MEIKTAIENENVLREMCAHWDQQNPHNPVQSNDNE